MNRKEQIKNSEHHRALCSVCFLFLCFFITQLSFAQGIDSTKYDINDPRNPNCPCHQLQKLAEMEFEQSKNSSSDIVINKNEQKKEQLKSLGSSVNTGITIHKRKKRTLWITKMRFRYSQRFRGIDRIQTDYSVCYTW